ncbi:diacylglycerol kinase [Pseudoalteromonas sp. MIP2626]|uniref:diacylglycerol kinase n=1 Tax=Pseudoalteromonas sp. MIP2626 TaxID=2705464 RepID=UPI0015CBEA72|nr:diacylglycerol kinase [Pseudoalteromonas sp. MIP2626]NYR14153.1 diacylglycerol kinase [Pseudoalteromonas sp. MIP2626]
MKDVLKPNCLGLKRVFKASYCSYLGFKAAFKEEVAFRQELLLCIILLPLSFWLASSLLHWALLVSTLLIMLIVELLNSAIEALTDRVSTERHVLSGRAKDMGSAAVTLALSIVVIIWGISLYIKIV